MGVLDVSPTDVTEGSMALTLVALAVPLVVQNLVHVVNQLVDTFWLGRVGETAVAAVGIGAYYVRRRERMFSSAASEASGLPAD